ncbi:MAG TPA: phosphoglycerate kinase [Magnetospirillaceae bacterium]|nr:phosphoglycerate kinase [Magnetospirillaceae bacterium]
MPFTKKTIKDVPLEHKTVLVRADYNVPMRVGAIADDYRIVQSLPTLQFLIKAGCKVVIMAHLGRPKGKVDKTLSLESIAGHLGKLLEKKVIFVPDCVGDRVKVAVKNAKPGDVLLLENVRFHPGDEENDASFAKRLAIDSSADYFVQDGFGVVHRAHASTEGVTHILPSVAGLLLEKEASTITDVMKHPKRPLVAVLGGAKVSDKITVIQRFVDIADQIIIGGAMANTFFAYRGWEIGKSVYEPGEDQLIERIYADARRKTDNVDEFILLPTDVAVAPEIGGHKRTIVDVRSVQSDDYILDLGPTSTDLMLAHIKNAATVVWSGTLGYTEDIIFAYSSAKLATALAAQKAHTFSVVGGGDTADFVLHWDKKGGDSFGLVSTGGSASLELMAGQTLPGIAALMNA